MSPFIHKSQVERKEEIVSHFISFSLPSHVGRWVNFDFRIHPGLRTLSKDCFSFHCFFRLLNLAQMQYLYGFGLEGWELPLSLGGGGRCEIKGTAPSFKSSTGIRINYVLTHRLLTLDKDLPAWQEQVITPFEFRNVWTKLLELLDQKVRGRRRRKGKTSGSRSMKSSRKMENSSKPCNTYNSTASFFLLRVMYEEGKVCRRGLYSNGCYLPEKEILARDSTTLSPVEWFMVFKLLLHFWHKVPIPTTSPPPLLPFFLNQKIIKIITVIPA